ncbi:MAG: family 43 glycosylhydrolase [Microthrixaceae bacterium]
MSGRVRAIAITGLVLVAVALGSVFLFGGDDGAESGASGKKATPAGPTTTNGVTATTTPTVPPPAEPVLEPVTPGPPTTVARGARKACGSGAGTPACRVNRTLRRSVVPDPEPGVPLLEAVSPTSYGDVDLRDAADPAVLVEGQTYFVFTTTASQLVPVHVIPGASVTRVPTAPDLQISAPTTTTSTTTTTNPRPRATSGTTAGAVGTAGTTAAEPGGARTVAGDTTFVGPQVSTAPINAMPIPPAWAVPNSIWAPTVEKIGGRFVMFFAAKRPNPPDPTNPECIGRAVAASPEGPYTPDAVPFTCGLNNEKGALDPSFFRDRDGSLTLLVALGGTETNIWGIPLTAEGAAAAFPTPLLTRKQPWEKFFLENPSMVFDGEYYLLAYSAGDWRLPDYSTGLARCRTPLGPCSSNPVGPWLSSAGGLSGTGGLSFFIGVDGSLFAAMHAYRAGDEGERGKRDTYLVPVDLRRESIRLG